MDHSAHMHHGSGASPMDMGHGGMPSGGHRCQMSMLFTWNTQDLCLVFRWWHVSGPISLIFSLLGVVVLCMGYEYVRSCAHRYDASLTAAPLDAPTEDSTLLTPGLVRKKKSGKLIKGAFYGAQVFYSFFIMLLFMTYNGWVMIAVAVGAMLGYLVWGDDEPAGKSVACH
ncbi:Ctr copper transporter family-domain-containing protein [Pyronema omphalodes]|nr:Ctr copper transporter family-domain-containing protein [Pyronema omphalodes]